MPAASGQQRSPAPRAGREPRPAMTARRRRSPTIPQRSRLARAAPRLEPGLARVGQHGISTKIDGATPRHAAASAIAGRRAAGAAVTEEQPGSRHRVRLRRWSAMRRPRREAHGGAPPRHIPGAGGRASPRADSPWVCKVRRPPEPTTSAPLQRAVHQGEIGPVHGLEDQDSVVVGDEPVQEPYAEAAGAFRNGGDGRWLSFQATAAISRCAQGVEPRTKCCKEERRA